MTNFTEFTPPGVAEVTETLIFKTLWSRMPAKSFISGLWLRSYINTPLWQNCFLRVLPVSKYRYFQFYFGNIILATPGERALWEQAPEEERIQYALDLEEKSRGNATANWKGVKELEEQLILQYKRSFPTTRGMIVNCTYNLEEQQKIIGKLNREFWKDFK